MIRVALFSYPASFQNIGGGEIVVLKTLEYLRSAGVKVKLFDMWQDRIEDFDVLHVFGTVKDCLGLMQVAKDRGVLVVNTPIIWSSFKRAINTFGTPKEKAELFIRHLMKVVFPAFPSSRRRMLQVADLILPNAQSELNLISRLFSVPADKMRVVFNGVDESFTDGDAHLFQEKYGVENFVLSIGRIEPRKNQLNLIKALKGSGRQLVLIGDAVSGFSDYEKKCRREGEGFVHFVSRIDHDSPLMRSAYKASAVYVLPGWFETPGLVAMEAALSGTRLAVTEEGSTRDYFEDAAAYFDPSKPDRIRDAVESACLISDDKVNYLKKKMQSECLWSAVASRTVQCYEEALAAGKVTSQ